MFSTAWSPAMPIFKELITIFGYDMTILWADECWGVNCGKLTYSRSEHVCSKVEDYDMPDAEGFAKYIWDNY